MQSQKNSHQKRSQTLYRRVEDVIGCKWSVCVLQAIRSGVMRPGALERHIEGISTKVLNERLRKLSAFGLIEKHEYPEIPPRVEYTLTPYGEKLAGILEQIADLQSELSSPE